MLKFIKEKELKNICIDIGNTEVKAGLFDGDNLIHHEIINLENVSFLGNLIQENNVKHSILSNVGKPAIGIESLLKNSTQLIEFNHLTPLPFKNEYLSPKTLGLDRLALTAASINYLKNTNILVISSGTCVTFEFISRKGSYLGGAISPGLNMRLKSMSEFTANLPQLLFDEPLHFNGNTTETCMQSGAFFGLIEEMKGRINLYETQFGPTEILLSGGNCFLFEKHLKKALFAHPYLTLFGLNKILLHNV